MRSRRMKRRGFTLIEILVVITIIAILMTLLVAAVQQVRAIAYRSTCSNNIKNVVLAMHAFSSTSSGKLPGTMMKSPGRFSIFTEILPNLEMGTAYDKINFKCPQPTVTQIQTQGTQLQPIAQWTLGQFTETQSQNNIPAPHLVVLETKVPAFLCPVDQTSPNAPGSINYVPIVTATGGKEGTSSSGITIEGIWPPDNEFPPLPNTPPTTFTNRVIALKLENIKDGTSNTAGIVEKVKGRFPAGRADTKRNVGFTGSSDSLFYEVDGFIQTDNTQMVTACKQSTTQGTFNDLAGTMWLQHTCQWLGCANMMAPPNARPCQGSNAATKNAADSGNAPPSSYHSGGANIGMMDGGVLFLSDSTDLKVVHALGTPNGGDNQHALER